MRIHEYSDESVVIVTERQQGDATLRITRVSDTTFMLEWRLDSSLHSMSLSESALKKAFALEPYTGTDVTSGEGFYREYAFLHIPAQYSERAEGRRIISLFLWDDIREKIKKLIADEE